MKAIAALLLLVGLSTAPAQPQSAKLTLACQGTTTDTITPDAKPEPVSMGIIVDFTAGTVQGFTDPPIKITSINDVTIAFAGFRTPNHNPTDWTINGSIDRVTGDVDATFTVTDIKMSRIITSTTYALKCRPTQRMF